MVRDSEQLQPQKLVLLVEDDQNIGEVLVEAISQETPHQVLLATNGASALLAAQSQKPDLIILDYHLPRMTGIELYDRLQAIKELSSIPTLMISAHLPLNELAKRKITGMNKPLDLDDFLQTIENLLA